MVSDYFLPRVVKTLTCRAPVSFPPLTPVYFFVLFFPTAFFWGAERKFINKFTTEYYSFLLSHAEGFAIRSSVNRPSCAHRDPELSNKVHRAGSWLITEAGRLEEAGSL